MQSRIQALRHGAWFFLFNSVILLLIGIRYFEYISGLTSFLSIVYIVFATISHFIYLSFIVYLLLYLPVVLVCANRTFVWVWAGITSSLGSLILLIDTFVFNIYRFHINGFVLDLVFGGAATQIFEFSTIQYIILYAVLLLLLSVSLASSFFIFRYQSKHTFTRGWWIAGCVIAAMLFSHVTHAWADATGYTSITKSSRYYPLFFPAKGQTLFLKLGIINQSDIAKKITLKNEAADLDYPKHPIVCDNKKKQNIIIILLDSWYFKVLDSTTMPNVFHFAKRCDVFNNHFSGSNGTRTGVFSLFYSIPGIYWDDVLASQTSPIFIDELLKMNYEIKTFASASLASPPFDHTIFRKVPDLDIETAGEKAHNRDRQLTQNWISYSKKRQDSHNTGVFMSFLFYDALHAYSHPRNSRNPFQPEWDYPKYEQLNNNSDPKPMLNLYKNTAYYVDSLLGLVFKQMEASGLLANSMIIITGDHAQEFNDNKKNFWGHNSNYSAAQLHVPFLLYTPGNKHQTYSHWTSHYDVIPTIFQNLFNCKNNTSDYSCGKNLYNTTRRDWLLVGSKDNFAIVQPNKITSVNFDGSYEITDNHLNTLQNTKLEINFINPIMLSSKSFYKN